MHNIQLCSQKRRYSILAPEEICFKVLIHFMDVGNFILAGDSIEIRETSLLMQFLAAGDVLFGSGPSNIIWNMLWRINLWWVTHYSAWTPTDFKESAHSARTHSEVKTWPQAQRILTQQKIHFELCLGKALCTSVGDGHHCVWCCFLAVLDAGERKFINSSSEATRITKSSGTAFLTSCYVHCFHLSGLQTLGFLSVCHPAPVMSFSEVISVLSVHFGLWNEMPGTAQIRSSQLNLVETPQYSIDFFSSQYLIKYHFTLDV